MIKDPPLTIGIEEEYLLVDVETRNLAIDPPPALMELLERKISGRIAPEFLKAQVEVETGVHQTIAAARDDLTGLRQALSEGAAEFGLAPVAAGSHPFALWGDQEHVDKDRYNALARDLQAVARRLLICGMHVHIGIDDDDLRIDLMNQATYFLPHLLALSTSSPFWQGQETGLMSYRTSVFDGLPRTGLPEQFSSYSEYRRLVDAMVGAGVVEDATRIWWDMRPSARFPTLEMRSTDCLHVFGRRHRDCGAFSVHHQHVGAPPEEQPAMARLPSQPRQRESVARATLRRHQRLGGSRQR